MPQAFVCGPHMSTYTVYFLVATSGRQYAIHADILRRFSLVFRTFVWAGHERNPIYLGTPYATEAALSIFTRWIYARSTLSFVKPSLWYYRQADETFEDLVDAWLLGERLGSPDFCNHVIRLFMFNDLHNIPDINKQQIHQRIPHQHRLHDILHCIWWGAVLFSEPELDGE
ncbi:hypothetical protein F4820DRAFT_447658 [Hypoxylon rubiginosum]|uniref:Uncharacterized protein n=1 Tax=Hypoxylon rubiginosum TaxID=110542 RepID=A0ACB9Z2E7_9PEZI|nr:hypothetical protein F4820DRAFT_447658 [Hypoxylon rubiginosum]